MSLAFAREKRLLLGALALFTPLPLPLNEVVGWHPVVAFVAGVVFFLWHSSRGREVTLAPWMMNLLGLFYLPLFWIDLRHLSGGRLVGPVVHLALFAILIKLFALRRERDKWQVLMGIFFLFLAAMATSVHPAVVIYLAVFLAASLRLLTRFAHLHLVAGFGHRDGAVGRLPLGGFLAVATAASLALAVPLFALLPRVTNPYIMGRGAGTGTVIQAMGFSDVVTLDSIGRIRTNREVAMRVLYQGVAPAGEMRLKAATFDRYDGRSWQRTPVLRVLRKEAGDALRLAPGPLAEWADIWLQPVTMGAVPMPVGTRQLELPMRGITIGRGGAIHLQYPPQDVVEYTVGVGDPSRIVAEPPGEGTGEPTLETSAVTPRMAALAARVGGGGTPAERARRLEQYFADEFEYTLDLVGRQNEDPLEEFLFETRRGHCEYFASAMVLLLRSEGIPSRLATGFLGGDFNPLMGYYIVRQSNAHAWVEAYLPETGWTVYDPTPAAGRPAASTESWLDLATQTWDLLSFRWDRYVLTYGFGDQVRLFAGLRGLWASLRALVQRTPAAPGADGDAEALPATAASASASAAREGLDSGRLLVYGLLALALAAVAVVLVLRHRPPLTATRAYRRLRRAIAGAGRPLAASTAPLAVGRQAAARHPDAAEPAARVVALYLRESFGEEDLDEAERQDLRRALARATHALVQRTGEGSRPLTGRGRRQLSG